MTKGIFIKVTHRGFGFVKVGKSKYFCFFGRSFSPSVNDIVYGNIIKGRKGNEFSVSYTEKDWLEKEKKEKENKEKESKIINDLKEKSITAMHEVRALLDAEGSTDQIEKMMIYWKEEPVGCYNKDFPRVIKRLLEESKDSKDVLILDDVMKTFSDGKGNMLLPYPKNYKELSKDKLISYFKANFELADYER